MGGWWVRLAPALPGPAYFIVFIDRKRIKINRNLFKMDIDEENILSRRSYKLEKLTFDNFNILYSSSNSMIVLWNKYQIFIYNNFKLQSPTMNIVPEFQLYHLIALANYLVCLDNAGNIHLTSLKFKNARQTCKITFQPRDQDIKTCIMYNHSYILGLKYEADTYFLHLRRVDSNFPIVKSIILLFHNDQWPIKENSAENYTLMKFSLHNKAHNELIKTLFKVTLPTNVIYDLLILSFDNFSVYGCLYSPDMDEDEANLVKLYNCPAEICTIEIIDSEELYLIIALTMGTIIRLSLRNALKPPDVIHLNTSLYKTLIMRDSILYSDGETMWKTENTFLEDRKLIQFFVKDVKDFIKCGDQIICTTFTKLLYTFSIEDRNSFIIPKSTEGYYSAMKLFTHAGHFKTLFKEIDDNIELVRKITSEQTYISALALSKRQAVLKKAIESSVCVYENYEEIDKSGKKLTEDLKEYFVPDTWIFLVKISNSGVFDILNGILSQLSESIQICITIFADETLLKSTTLKLDEPLEKVNFLIPLLRKTYEREIKVNIKIIIKTPGSLDSQPAWTVLYRNDIIINCEHFIKLNRKNTAVCLMNPRESYEKLMNEITFVQHSCLFSFHDQSKPREYSKEWSFYVKLPNNYCQLFRTNNFYKRHFHPNKSTLLHEQLSAKEFLATNTSVILSVGNEKLKIKIQNDGFSSPLLVVTGKNIKMAFNLRNFFSYMLYNDYEDLDLRKEFIYSTFYTTTKNLQKAVKEYIVKSSSNEEFISLMDKFEKHVFGDLPL